MAYFVDSQGHKIKVLQVVKVEQQGYYPIDYFSFSVEDVVVGGVTEKHLIMSYCGDTPPAFSINNRGHLIYSGDDILDLKLDIPSGHLKWNL